MEQPIASFTVVFERLVASFLEFGFPGVVLSLIIVAAIQLLLWWSCRTKPFLDPEEFKPLRLRAKKLLNHNTVMLRFNLPSKSQRLVRGPCFGQIK